ncbi:matrix-remodeling-associated protein 8-like [Sinocyclocheilus rhinocerous]|uniref:matrix-remodeling-associated protein 8-like n=1 Tax=Sinocyclocheilus rhinocerous TaxID=307959 RepID=UPI0007B860B6|nr:PREDICTED: matrix-remodeling-associated protein 8-like [Sinocyclocheilus rhinocerous]
MMRSFQSSYFQHLYLPIAALLECKAQTRRPYVHQLNINCVQGDSMTISCLTTTHPLESLTVKLHKKTQDKVILIYPDISPASEHQRWSVRKEDGNVTLHLKDIRLSDDGFYDCQVYKDQDCLHSTRFNLRIIKCQMLNAVHATLNSSVLLPCSEHPLQNRTDQVTWKIVNDRQSTEITQYRLLYNPLSTTEKRPKPLYERARKQANGSLLIRNAVHTDESWYRCRANEKTCYEMKLVMKASADSPFGQA